MTPETEAPPAPEPVTEDVTGEPPAPDTGSAEEAAPAPDRPGQESSSGEGPSQEDKKRVTRREARRRARDRAKSFGEEMTEPASEDAADTGGTTESEESKPKRDAKGNLHDPRDGKFVPKGEEEAADDGGTEQDVAGEEARDEQVTDAPAAETPSEDEGGDAEAAEKPSEFIPVELPEDDRLRQTGQSAIKVVDQVSADMVKGVLNREAQLRSEIADIKADRDEYQRENVRLKSGQSAVQKWKQSPEYQAAAERYHKLADLEDQGQVPEGTAMEYWEGKQHELRALQEKEYKEQWGEVTQERIAQQADAWTKEARRRTEALPEPVRSLPDFPRWFDEAVDQFDYALANGHYPDVKGAEELHEAFKKVLGGRLMQEESVRQVYQRVQKQRKKKGPEARQKAERSEEERQREIEAAEKRGAEKLRREAADRREKTPPHPMGTVSGAERPGSSLTESEDSGEDTGPMTPNQRRRARRKRARERAREHFG